MAMLNMLGDDMEGKTVSNQSNLTPFSSTLCNAGISTPNRSHLMPSSSKRITLFLPKMRERNVRKELLILASYMVQKSKPTFSRSGATVFWTINIKPRLLAQVRCATLLVGISRRQMIEKLIMYLTRSGKNTPSFLYLFFIYL